MVTELDLLKNLDDEQETDRVVRALSNARRRVILSHLATDSSEAGKSGKPYTLDELTDIVAAAEPSDEAALAKIQMLLHHHHLPHLDECGLLEYDSRSNTVRYHGHPLVEEL